MEAHESRVVSEHDELISKIDNLSNFIEKSQIYLTLDSQNKKLLVKQLKHMKKYCKTLRKRIQLFTY